MSAFGRGTLATALATAVAVVAPALAQENVAGKPEPGGAASITLQNEVPLTTTTQAGNYSEEHPVVAIVVAKGKKEGGLTGQEIGDTLAQALIEKYQVPSKVFVRQSAGDYSNVVFFIKGRLYGSYSLGKSIEALAWISRDFDRAHGLPFQRNARVDGKPAPEPGQD